MKDRLAALRLFVRVARKGSFSAAARELGVPQPTASRTIAALEREIGAALFTRTTRAVALTEAGADYLARIEPILAELEEADHAARGGGELRGVLRVGLSSSLGVREITPRLPRFMDRHPALRLELIVDDQRQDLVGEGVDVALRFGALADSTAVARPIAVYPVLIVAAPSYLAAAGAPTSPADLAMHASIGGAVRGGQDWSFRKNGQTLSVRVESRISATAHEARIAAAVAGLGIAYTSIGGCRLELQTGTLVRVLPGWDLGEVQLNAVFAAGRAAKPSARAFAEFLTTELSA
jgi:DNA-binding transcriptional LysR family regulator